MDFDYTLRIIQTLIFAAGTGVALVQLRQYHRARERDSALQLVHSFQTADFSRAIMLLLDLPEGLSKRAAEERLGDKVSSIYQLVTTFESIGVLVYRGEVSLALVDDFYSGFIKEYWSRCQRFVEDVRRETKRETFGEWGQWLAERMQEREQTSAPVGAHVAHRNWRSEA